ncbi:MAG TPA: hypothetical protein VGV93_07255 [Acidimicrobiales bacterium]|nr:hypothetical protein [Acidimicrobiales bacterium]
MRSFWPAAEAAQADYEVLREAVLAGGQALTLAAGRFERRGLAGLIAWPASEPVFLAQLAGAVRPAWTPHVDPRLEALAAGYELLLASPAQLAVIKEAQR